MFPETRNKISITAESVTHSLTFAHPIKQKTTPSVIFLLRSSRRTSFLHQSITFCRQSPWNRTQARAFIISRDYSSRDCTIIIIVSRCMVIMGLAAVTPCWDHRLLGKDMRLMRGSAHNTEPDCHTWPSSSHLYMCAAKLNQKRLLISLTDSWGGVDEIQCGGG